MSPAWSKRAEELFDVACTLPLEERASFLDEACGRDEALREEVASLLTARDQAKKYFSSLGERLGLAAIFDEEFELPEQEQIGAYRLIRLLGRGGMGAVYLAERADDQYRKRVALKILPIGMGSAEMRRRFLAERQMLAQLVHPNVARLLDGGVTDRGTPYFVMDYVEGTPIDEYCGKHRLGIEDRLRLFRQVCDAVQFAHRNLIVHRDLKPGNVLVEEPGEVKLLDFGIAKALDPHVTYAELTRVGSHPMTPQYASPEAIRGEPITTAADVYSLGVLLYELVTGQYPYRLSGDSAGAIETAILGIEPKRPSDAVGDPSVRKALRGDVDTIILKALKKTPAERYATVNALLEDLGRHASGHPVLAQPDSAMYRLGKFMKRNKLAVGSGLTVLVAIVTAAAVAVWQAGIARNEQRRAEQVKAFVVSVFADADPYHGQGGPVSAKQLLQQARDRIDTVSATYPGMRLELLNLVGAGLVSLGEIEHAEEAVRSALDEVRHFPASDPRALEARLLAAEVHRFKGRMNEMRKELNDVLSALDTIGEQEPALLVQAHTDVAHLEIEDRNSEAAMQAAQTSLDLAIRALGNRHPRTIESALTLGEAHLAGSVPDKSILDSVDEALEVVNVAYSDQPEHPYMIQARQIRGRALAVAGYFRRAVEELEKTVIYASDTFGPTNLLVADYAGGVAPYQRRIGEIERALESSDQSMAIFSEHVKRDSNVFGWSLTSRGVTLLAARRGADALRDLGEAEQILEKLLGPAHWDTLTARFSRAIGLAYLGRHDEAREALAPIQDQPDVIANRMWALHVLGIVERLMGNYQAAVDAQTESLTLIVDGPRADWDRLRNLVERGQAALELGRLDEGAADLALAAELFQRLEIRMDPTQAEVLVGLGRIEMMRGNAIEALPRLEEADQFWTSFDPGNRWAGEAAYWLGKCYEKLGHAPQAERTLARAKGILSRSPLRVDAVLLSEG